MRNDARWPTIHDALLEHFRANKGQQTVPSRAFSPDGPSWETATEDAEQDGFEDWLGIYRPMQSPGRIELDFERLLCFATSIAEDMGGIEPLSVSQREQVFVIAGYDTYQHELFHHYCDLIRTMHGLSVTPAGRLREEALAVAYSWHCINRLPDLWQGFSAAQRERVTALSFDYRKPGYRDWGDFTEWHHFLRSACEHMWGDAAHTLARNNFFLEPFLKVLFDDPTLTHGSVEVFRKHKTVPLTAPLRPTPASEPCANGPWDRAAQEAWLDQHLTASWSWNAQEAVDVDGDVILRDMTIRELPVRFGRIRGKFDCSGIGLASVANLPKQVDGDLICCNNHFASLPNIHGIVEQVGGRICFHDNPLARDVMGLTLIQGGQRVGLNPYPTVRRIFARHEGKLNDAVFDVQTELIDEGFVPFAEP